MRRGIRFNSGQIFNLENSVGVLHQKVNNLLTMSEVGLRTMDKVASGYARSKMTLEGVLPFETNDDVRAFCVQDGRQNERSEALIEYLRIKGDPASISKYVFTLSRTVFDPEYLATHRWPSPK